jgi:YegS/Rv2252/BmrU family lipid kinase
VLGLQGDALFSEETGHLRELARQAVEGGATQLVAVGGDGTINEVVNGLAGADGVELAVIPRGTGGDFVRTFGIPSKLEDAVRVALEGRVREIDLGRAVYQAWSGEVGESYFANIASAGMSGAVAKRTNESTSAPLGGKIAYLWSTVVVFLGWKNAEIRVTVDGEERSGPMFDVIVANCRYLGGGMKITPDAEPDDGLFDVLLIGDVSKLDLALTMPKIYRGTHLPHPRAELLRGSSVAVESPEPLPVELDGEQPGTTPVQFDVVPKALRLRVPSSS